MAIRNPSQIKPDRPMQVNMTGMVDIVFLLIIFFVLVSQFISADNILVELPEPDKSLAKAVELPDRVVLNCRNAGLTPEGKPRVQYLLGPISIETTAELEQRLRAVKEARPEVQVLLRADRNVTYYGVRAAIQAVAKAGIEIMNIAAEVEE